MKTPDNRIPPPPEEREPQPCPDAPRPFSPETIHRCWELAQGRCECQREGHGHTGRCGKPLSEGRHGMLGDDGWFTCPWEQPGADQAENCDALCWACYERTKQGSVRAGPDQDQPVSPLRRASRKSRRRHRQPFLDAAPCHA